MKDQDKSYHVALVRVLDTETMRMGVKSCRTQHFGFYWEQRVDMR